MNEFKKHEFVAYLQKADLRKAVSYLSKFPEKKDLSKEYRRVFAEGGYLQRTDNEIIDSIDRLYQNYYRNVFWEKISNEAAKEILFGELWAFCGSKPDMPKNSSIEAEIKRLVNEEGYEFLGGDTQGFWGPYIWKDSVNEVYQVELPGGLETYTVTMMDGFISRSWLHFISFGKSGTGGWIGKDGTLCCVRSLWDVDSDEFKFSFLKHEAQHGYDKKRFPGITTAELEYRAKLVELMYYPNDKIIKSILREADNSNPDNSHSMAAYRIIHKMSQKFFACEFMADEEAWEDFRARVSIYAGQLLKESDVCLG